MLGASLRFRPGCAAFLVGTLISLRCASVVAQSPSMPSTLRYGSGLLDVPVSSVLGHLQGTATFSGIFLDLDRRQTVTPDGEASGLGPGVDEFATDFSIAVGLFDRAEVGASLQALGDASSGGDMWGLFGRVRLLEPVDQGLGLAVGGRYVSSPSFGDGIALEPGRLGIPDERLRTRYVGRDDPVDTNLTLYGVATAFLRGFDGGPLPFNDVTLSVGWGTGMFRGGGDLAFYSPGSSNGWFLGSSAHFVLAPGAQLALMAEYNGMDVNVGAQADVSGFRLGVNVVAANYARPSGDFVSEYKRPKLGLLGSVAVCPRSPGFRCRPRMMERVEPDTVWIPASPPDTVIVTVGGGPPPLPADAVEARLCLSTGLEIGVRVSAAGDTLVAPNWTALDDLRPALDFAGSYAGGAFWYESDAIVVFEGGDFGKSAEVFPIGCDQVLRVGVYQGVPVFADRSAERPLDVLFVPVRPGAWRRYERGLR